MAAFRLKNYKLIGGLPKFNEFNEKSMELPFMWYSLPDNPLHENVNRIGKKIRGGCFQKFRNQRAQNDKI